MFFDERLTLETLAAEIPGDRVMRLLCRSGAIRDLRESLSCSDLPAYTATVNALIPVMDFTPGSSQMALRPLALMCNEVPTAAQVENLMPLWTADTRPSGGKIIKDREVLKLVVKKMSQERGPLTAPMAAIRAALEARLNSFVLH